jgi:cytoskeletal protein RodZ
MGKNLSLIDRGVHLVLGFLLVLVALTMMKDGLGLFIVALIGVLIIFMGLLGWSGIYSILGISTKKSAHSKISGNDIKKAVRGHIAEVKESKTSTTKKKAPAKKSVAKKTTAKTSTSKTVTKKVPAKKSVAKKVAMDKKAPVKKSTTTKASATKKAPAKKSVVKK